MPSRDERRYLKLIPFREEFYSGEDSLNIESGKGALTLSRGIVCHERCADKVKR